MGGLAPRSDRGMEPMAPEREWLAGPGRVANHDGGSHGVVGGIRKSADRKCDKGIYSPKYARIGVEDKRAVIRLHVIGRDQGPALILAAKS
jgi:hypothetical protein